jgi:glycerate kinase
MKIVASFDSFKGGMSAQEACRLAAMGIREADPRTEVLIIPLADGGEGTAEILCEALGGHWVSVQTMGPLPEMRVASGFAWVPSRNLAIVEMARSSGLPLMPPNQRNPLLTTTYGTGQLLRAAMEQGAAEVWLTVGGSATVDGGVGAAMALGWRFADEQGRDIGLGGGALQRLRHIAPPSGWSFPPCRVLCDVSNPLVGPRGAARVFGPQKGASVKMVSELEIGLTRFADIVRKEFGIDLSTLSGGGAAGGLAAGAHLFLKAELVSGIEAVLSAVNYRERIRNADWVLTGEGCFDHQSLSGKVVSGVVKAAKANGIHVAVLAGSVKLTEAEWRAAGVDFAVALSPPEIAIEQAIANEREFLKQRSRQFYEHITSA